MSERKKRGEPDIITIVKVALVVVAMGAVLELVACQTKNNHEKVPEPDKELVQAMIDYCRVGDLPRDKWLEAQRAWGFQNGGDQKVMSMWNRASPSLTPKAYIMPIQPPLTRGSTSSVSTASGIRMSGRE